MREPALSARTITLAGLLLVVLVGTALYLTFRSPKEAPVTEEPTVEEVTAEPVRRVIGTSVEGRSIEAYTYGTGDTHLLFVGGIHGGYEWNSVLLAYGVMDEFAADPTLIPENLSITIVPSANPDGVYAVVGKEGRFTAAEVPDAADGVGRFNANDVDLNRNFACKWQPESMWRGETVSAGTAAFSEPEARAIRDLVSEIDPEAVVFWHSQSNAVYASECEEGVLTGTRTLMNAYATAAGYPAVDSFTAYAITGDAEGWLASVGIPAVTVELSTHESIEWTKNWAGVQALLAHYGTADAMGR